MQDEVSGKCLSALHRIYLFVRIRHLIRSFMSKVACESQNLNGAVSLTRIYFTLPQLPAKVRLSLK